LLILARLDARPDDFHLPVRVSWCVSDAASVDYGLHEMSEADSPARAARELA